MGAFAALPDGKVVAGSEEGDLLVWEGGLIKVGRVAARSAGWSLALLGCTSGHQLAPGRREAKRASAACCKAQPHLHHPLLPLLLLAVGDQAARRRQVPRGAGGRGAAGGGRRPARDSRRWRLAARVGHVVPGRRRARGGCPHRRGGAAGAGGCRAATMQRGRPCKCYLGPSRPQLWCQAGWCPLVQVCLGEGLHVRALAGCGDGSWLLQDARGGFHKARDAQCHQPDAASAVAGCARCSHSF